MNTWKLSRSWPGYVPLRTQFLFPYRSAEEKPYSASLRWSDRMKWKTGTLDKCPTQPIFSRSSKMHMEHMLAWALCTGYDLLPLPVYPVPETYHNSLLLTQKQAKVFQGFHFENRVMREEKERRKKGRIFQGIRGLTVLNTFSLLVSVASPSMRCVKEKCQNPDNSPQMYFKENILTGKTTAVQWPFVHRTSKQLSYV